MQSALRSHVRDEVETLSAEDMERLQVERVRAGLERVSRSVPFYAARLRAAGVTADQIRSRADLARLPFTTKQDLRDSYPFGMLAVPMKQVVRLHASSGTTGKPTVGPTRRRT